MSKLNTVTFGISTKVAMLTYGTNTYEREMLCVLSIVVEGVL